MSAQIDVLYWRDIPAVVKARGPFASARRELPTRFTRAINQTAEQLGISDFEAFLDEYCWHPSGALEGPAGACAEQYAQQLEAEFPAARLKAMVELAADYQGGKPEVTPGREMTIPG